MELVKRNVQWRYPMASGIDYPSCSAALLGDGVLVYNDHGLRVKEIVQGVSDAYYTANCYRDEPTLPVCNRLLMDLGAATLPLVEHSWDLYVTSRPDADVFKFSGYPIIYTICAATVIVLFITVTIFTKGYLSSQKPSYLLKISSLLSSAQVLVMYCHALVEMRHQYRKGRFSSNKAVDSLLSSKAINALYLINLTLLQTSQAQIITRLFPRRKEKRFIFAVGASLSVISQILWGLSTFLSSTSDIFASNDALTGDSDVAILPAFTYLLRISLSVMYICLVSVYCISKRRIIFKTQVLPLTLALGLSINSPVAFFIADVANVWVSELSEVFDLTCYVIANFITWEWINRVIRYERLRQKDGILGRPFYEEDECVDPGAGLLSDYISSKSSVGSDIVQQQPPKHYSAFSDLTDRAIGVRNGLNVIVDESVKKILEYTDKLVLRSGSALSHGSETPQTHRPAHSGVHEVFVYEPRSIVVQPVIHPPVTNDTETVNTGYEDSILRHIERVNGESSSEDELYESESF